MKDYKQYGIFYQRENQNGKMKWEISSTYWIGFDKTKKTIECYETSDSPFAPSKSFEIGVDELKAINQQCRELDWLD